MNPVHTFFSGQKRNVAILILAGIVFRIYILYTENVNKISFDGHQYYTAAYNLSQGHGYSISEKEPFEPFYFREPGLIYFYSFIIDICKITNGKQAEFPVFTKELTFDNLDPVHKSNIKVIKWIQAIMQIITIILFYFIVSEQYSRKSGFIAALFLSLYFPFAYISTDLLRETLVSLLLTLLTFGWMKYYTSRHAYFLMFIGIIWGLATLTFQVYVILGWVFLLYLWFLEPCFTAKFSKSMAMLLVFGLTLSPWIIKVYRYYPDPRVAKTIGVSLTHEMMDLAGAIRKADYYKKEKLSPYDIFYNKTASKQFRESFDGTYKRKTDSINQLINEPLISKRKFEKYATSFVNTFYITFTFDRIKTLKDPFNPKNIIKSIYLLINIIAGTFSILGLVLFGYRYRLLLPVVLFHLLFFTVLGSEARRQVVIIPFMILFCVLGLNWFMQKSINRNLIED
jgi:4-amino-4-deoxy-L-arabinose transferase-like glycosyltransferase